MDGITSWAELTLDALADAVLVCRRGDYAIEHVNAAATRLFRVPAERLCGVQLETLLPERVRAIDGVPLPVWIEARARGGQPPIRAPFLRSDGVEIHQAIHTSAPSERALVLLLRPPSGEQDIDPLSAGRQSQVESSYRALFDAVPVGVVTFDKRGLVTACNDVILGQLGSARERLIGVDLLTLPDLGVRAAVQAALQGSLGRFEGDYRPAMGTRRSVIRLLVSPILRDGAIAGGIAVLEDITERRRIEAQLAQGERMASLGRLAAGVAHEINNPLAYVRTSLELARRELDRLRRDQDARHVARADELLGHADEGVERVRVIAGDLKTFSRGDDGSWMPVDLNAVVESAINLAWNEIRHRAQLLRELAPIPKVMGSESRFAQVMVNLLVNAAQAIPEGDAQNQRIIVRTGVEDEQVWVEVQDTGTGIARDLLEHVFEPFWTSKPRSVGTGLGLSICHGIVAAAGGTIAVADSRPGQTTLRIELPIGSDAEEALPTVPAFPARSSLERASILVVDDEPKLAATLRIALGDRYDVQVATSGRSALETLRSGADLDLVLCDLMMPELSGMDVYERVLAERPALAQRFVFMTGGAFTERAHEFLNRHDVRRLEKPFELDAIENLLGRAPS